MQRNYFGMWTRCDCGDQILLAARSIPAPLRQLQYKLAKDIMISQILKMHFFTFETAELPRSSIVWMRLSNGRVQLLVNARTHEFNRLPTRTIQDQKSVTLPL